MGLIIACIIVGAVLLVALVLSVLNLIATIKSNNSPEESKEFRRYKQDLSDQLYRYAYPDPSKLEEIRKDVTIPVGFYDTALGTGFHKYGEITFEGIEPTGKYIVRDGGLIDGEVISSGDEYNYKYRKRFYEIHPDLKPKP